MRVLVFRDLRAVCVGGSSNAPVAGRGRYGLLGGIERSSFPGSRIVCGYGTVGRPFARDASAVVG